MYSWFILRSSLEIRANAEFLVKVSLTFLVIALLSGCSLLSVESAGKVAPSTSEVEEISHKRTKRPPLQVTVKSSQTKREEGELLAPELTLTPEVKDQLYYFLGENRRFVVASLERLNQVERVISNAFRRNGVPQELIAVGFVESGFISDAKSASGARGIWQFMKGTARSYDLKINLFRDERLDPRKSSNAAAKHLRDLYTQFDDWLLALAAYNCGASAVSRAIAREGKRDFWELSYLRSFSRETREFVPKVIAAAIILDDPSRFGFAAR